MVDVATVSPWPAASLDVLPVGEIRWWNEGWQDLSIRGNANELGQCCRVQFRRFRIVDERCADQHARRLRLPCWDESGCCSPGCLDAASPP
jgi:hypothetical protein